MNASQIMKETGCQAVKIEAGEYAAATVRHLVDRGIPVMAHVGLRPQATNVDGGFKAKGRTDASVAGSDPPKRLLPTRPGALPW